MTSRYILIFILFINLPIFSQDVNFDKGSIKEKQYFEEITYEMVNDKIILPVVINNKKYRFLLDTGAPNLISKKVLEALNLEKTKNINVNDANNLIQSMQAVEIPNIQIGNLNFENQVALFFDIDNHNLLSCFQIDGFIGSNLLRNSILKICKSEQKITITNQIKNLNPKVKPSKIKLIGSQKAPYIEFNFIGKNNEKGSDMVLIDTGMDGLYEMSKRAFAIFDEHKVFEVKAQATGLNSVGLFGASEPTLQTLLTTETAQLNNATFKNIIVNTTDDNNSRIGLEFLNHGDLIFDFKNKNFYLEANETIDLKKSLPKYEPTVVDNKFVVGLVWDENLAKQMKFGDEIISIDATTLSDMKLCDVLSFKKESKTKNNYILQVKNKENKITTVKIEN